MGESIPQFPSMLWSASPMQEEWYKETIDKQVGGNREITRNGLVPQGQQQQGTQEPRRK